MFSDKDKNGCNRNISPNFVTYVEKAIELLAKSESNLSNKEVLNLLSQNGIPDREALDILTFLPITFVRHWLSTINWPETYIEFISEAEKVEKKFTENSSYQVIWRVTTNYFNGFPHREAIIKIGGRSSEFNVINQLLKENPGYSFADIKLSSTIIIH